MGDPSTADCLPRCLYDSGTGGDVRTERGRERERDTGNDFVILQLIVFSANGSIPLVNMNNQVTGICYITTKQLYVYISCQRIFAKEFLNSEWHNYVEQKGLQSMLQQSPPSPLAHLRFTEGSVLLSNTTVTLPWSRGSSPSSGSTLRDTEVRMA